MVTAPQLLAAPPELRPAAALAAVEAHAAGFESVRDAAAGCQACDLWARATQTVFGVGPVPARLMLVGEQPGDKEDIEGAPFVGPAGGMLAKAMEEAGLDRESAFVTNVVKHFKWRPTPGGKRRLHEKPNKVEIGACLPWVESELALVKPEALVLLGATAAGALIGPSISVTRDRGRALQVDLAPLVVATVHPSSILRAGAGREAAYAAFVQDLRSVAKRLDAASG
ncbi:MAG TPA: UdgX family uracil-DNA binding protein [Candidatus Limnocylindrales bacterium]|jgi:DNA polymerase|nr:UdgX family uracil-DNA binding protein [Candidatus Limnocylindrales bacterium]